MAPSTPSTVGDIADSMSGISMVSFEILPDVLLEGQEFFTFMCTAGDTAMIVATTFTVNIGDVCK